MLDVLTAILLVAAPATAPSPAAASIDPSTSHILGIALTDSEESVRRSLGPPNSVERYQDEMADAPAAMLKYDGIEVYLVGNEVYHLYCSASRCKTATGVAVGDAVKRVFEVYGPAEIETDDGSHFVRYGHTGTDCYLGFKLRDDRVVEIDLWFVYQ